LWPHAADILKEDVFGAFYGIFPDKFQNKTNGVTPRRWLAFCNPPLRQLITETLGSERWINDLNQLKASAADGRVDLRSDHL
jgi:starch phosphorylase